MANLLGTIPAGAAVFTTTLPDLSAAVRTSGCAQHDNAFSNYSPRHSAFGSFDLAELSTAAGGADASAHVGVERPRGFSFNIDRLGGSDVSGTPLGFCLDSIMDRKLLGHATRREPECCMEVQALGLAGRAVRSFGHSLHEKAHTHAGAAPAAAAWRVGKPGGRTLTGAWARAKAPARAKTSYERRQDLACTLRLKEGELGGGRALAEDWGERQGAHEGEGGGGQGEREGEGEGQGECAVADSGRCCPVRSLYRSLGLRPPTAHPAKTDIDAAGGDVEGRGGGTTTADQPAGKPGSSRIQQPRIGTYTPEQRRAKLARFAQKRGQRVWKMKVEYKVRKEFANSRLRVRGRFIGKGDEDLLREIMGMA